MRATALSLRAFARALSIESLRAVADPARQTARSPARNVRALGREAAPQPRAIAEHVPLEHESAVLAALERPGFRADSRWVATMAGIPLDEVNVTLQRLLRRRIVTMSVARPVAAREEA